MSENKFAQQRVQLSAAFRAGEIPKPDYDNQRRIIDAEEAQARMLAALPDFPRFGYYVKTGLAGYGPELDENDMPYTSWDGLSAGIAEELEQAADFCGEGASAIGDQAEQHYQHWQQNPGADPGPALFAYRDAWREHKRAEELSVKAMNFASLAKSDDPAPLYRGRPELRHARIWNLITEEFPLDISDNSRLYVWECAEDPGTDESGD